MSAPAEHAYGDQSDCTCGRNFSTVRGLREHLTKARQQPRPLQEVLDEHCAQVRAQREPKSRRKSAQEWGPWGPEGRPESPEALR